MAAVFDGYFADPFVLTLRDGSYVAYGSSGAKASGAHLFEALTSRDLLKWASAGPVLDRLDASVDEVAPRGSKRLGRG